LEGYEGGILNQNQIFCFQEPPIYQGLRTSAGERANRILSPARLPIPSHRLSKTHYTKPDGEKQGGS
jgi:hypothetical protein